MTALPMTLEEALNDSGYVVRQVEVAAKTIALDNGVIAIPEMVLSTLDWARPMPAELGDAFYLDKIPVFHEDYRPVILSSILDWYGTRRIGYNTPGEFRRAVRRWSNENLGAMSTINMLYRSLATTLPLDTFDEVETIEKDSTANQTNTTTLEGTTHALDIASEFPQSLIDGNMDYASNATDRRVADNTSSNANTARTEDEDETRRRSGRNQSVMSLIAEQRALFANPDQQLRQLMEPLFFGVFDQGEGVPSSQYGSGMGLSRQRWYGW